MAKTTVSELQVLISANAASFQAQLDAVKKQMTSMGAASNSMGSKLGAGLKGTIVKYAGLGAAITGAYKAMRTASSYIEDENLFAVSMDKVADSTRAWSDQVERSVGVSGAWLRKYTGVMTNMTQSMGLSHDTAAKLGKNVALLSQDIASFYNISPEAAFEKMQSAMAGMPRPLQELGIMARDQELEQTALAMGIRKTNGEFTSAQKALLTYETVIRSTKNAQGDLARTLNTPANQMRMLATNARNLGVAIGTMFQPLLSVALPALNAIIMAATSAIRALAGLFGIEFKADAGGIGEVASGVGGIGEAADKAGGKVKKLKGQLASFDEMNTLQEQDSGGGSGGGGGAGTLPTMDWSKYNAGLDNVKNKAVAMAEAIKKAFKDFGKGFDFAKIGNAFKRFFDDANKFLKPIGKILGDLWGYFKPFIYWTANDLLPAFLNALGGAINFVGAVIGRVWDSFLKPFVDAFLVPIASFTGGVIVWTLNAIGDALRWIAEQEGAVTTISNLMAIVGTGIAIWQGYQFVIGVVTAAQLAMNGVMVAGTAASGAYAAGIGAVTVAQKIGATATIIATAATKAFGVAMGIITSPITLVIAGIGLLVAGIVILIKNWEAVKTVAISVWENIKQTWLTVATWFDKHVIVPVKDFFVGLWNTVSNTAKSAWDGISGFFSGTWSNIKNIFNGMVGWVRGSFSNAWGNAWNGVKTIFSSIASGLGNIFKTPINFIISVINGFIRGLNRIKIPSWVPAVGGKGISIPEIPKLARGGLVSGSTIAMIGEAGREAVLPLDRNTGWMDELASKINGNNNTPINITVQVGDEVLLEKVINGINDLSFIRNHNVINI